MTQQIPVKEEALSGFPAGTESTRALTPDLAYRRLLMVNIVFLGRPNGGDWLLVDAGLTGTAGLIRNAAEGRFGHRPPAAIIQTHGHFDHVGALRALADHWDVPVYAHPFEAPYLNGSRSYPKPNLRAGGGIMSLLAPLYPRGPTNLGARLRLLPADGSVPHAPGWQWLHTPGHSDGHVSLWRESDRSLIAGDAFITTVQESAYAVVTQEPELHGPPRYYTPDWVSAGESVRALAALEPELVITGHGRPMHGPAMRTALHRLAAEFDRVAVPH